MLKSLLDPRRLRFALVLTVGIVVLARALPGTPAAEHFAAAATAVPLTIHAEATGRTAAAVSDRPSGGSGRRSSKTEESHTSHDSPMRFRARSGKSTFSGRPAEFAKAAISLERHSRSTGLSAIRRVDPAPNHATPEHSPNLFSSDASGFKTGKVAAGHPYVGTFSTDFGATALQPTSHGGAYSDRVKSPAGGKKAETPAAKIATEPGTGGSAVINFQPARDLSVGTQDADSTPATVMASADFDSDGIIDLITADRRGTLRFYRGNADSVFPNHPQARKHQAEGSFLDSPFFPSEKSLSLGAEPDFLKTGDFNGDGKKDILALTRGDNRLQLLWGDGRGNFSKPSIVVLDGSATALAVGEFGRPDGQTDVAVAVHADKGSQLLVFEHPEGAFKRKPESFDLPAPATSISFGQLDEDALVDIAVACGDQLVFIQGHLQIYPWDLMPEAGLLRPPAEVGQRSLGFRVSELATGKFTNMPGESLALLAEDGSLHLLEPPAPEKTAEAKPLAPASSFQTLNTPTGGSFERYKRLKELQPSPEEWTRRGYKVVDRTAASKTDNIAFQDRFVERTSLTETPNEKPPRKEPGLASSFYTAPSRTGEWRESLWLADSGLAAAQPSPKDSRLSRARVSDSSLDDLLIIDGGARQIHVVGRRDPAAGAQSAILASIDVEAVPTAVLPLRLNVDALSDLVVLRNGAPTPTVILSAPANTYTVDTEGDAFSTCQPAQPCTLRAAITAANANPGADSIVFDIPGGGVHTIAPETALPTIIDAVTIDATTQPGYAGTPVIEINGSDSIDAGVDGIKVRASDCVIRGLVINEFPGYVDEDTGSTIGGNGITLETLANQTRHTNNIIEGNFLGTDPTGLLDLGNVATGLIIFDVDNSMIGGTTEQARNVISGNDGAGISVVNGINNQFKGNYIGVNAPGTLKLNNSGEGFGLTGSFNTVGGDEAGAGNTISGNGDVQDFPATHPCGVGLGISYLSPADGNTNLTLYNSVKGNRIGTDPSGNAPLGNCWFGIDASPVTATVIGSITEQGRNVISDNGFYAINCTYAFSPVVLSGGFCIVSGNNIGTDITGTVAMRNDGRNTPFPAFPIFDVVNAEAAPDAFASVGAPGGTTQGGPCTGFCNLISGNDENLDPSAHALQGAAVRTFGEGLNGVFNNYIGTNRTGTAALPNKTGAVLVGNSFLGNVGLVLGTPDDFTPLGNLISGNTCGGANINATNGFGDSPMNAYMRNNLIGTDATGHYAVPNNPLGDCYQGTGAQVVADSVSSAYVGGTDKPGQGNIISGNGPDDRGTLAINGGVIVQGNYIGVGQDGTTPLGNGGNAIYLMPSTSRQSIIGGTGPNEQNLIRNNGGAGIFAGFVPQFPNLVANTDIRANSIFNNGGLGIDLAPLGVNPNDPGDADTGTNDLQNYPLLDSPVSNGNGTVAVHGWLNSSPNSFYRLDFYASSTGDSTKYGEGETYIGAKTVTTDNHGRVEFSFTSSGTVSSSAKITATATNAHGSTSEFSCTAGDCIADVGVEITDDPDPVAAGTVLNYTLNLTNAGPATATNVIVKDTLPTSVSYGSATPSQGSCSRSGVLVTCNLGSLNVGANATVTIHVTPTTEGEITDTASVKAAEDDPNPDNNNDTERTQVGPAIIIVTTNGDESDSDPNDNICDVDPITPGSQCTLRAAIELANSRAGRDAIGFNIPGGSNQTISPQSALPTISQAVSIDATTQPGYAGLPVIVLDGAAANSDALKITAGNCYIAGFAVTRFSGNGIVIQGGPGGNVVEGNIIGTDASGTNNMGLGGAAVLIDSSPNNKIGRGSEAVARLSFPDGTPRQPQGFLGSISNVFVASGVGVKIVGPSAIGNILKSDLVGLLLKNGTFSPLPNNLFGVLIQGAPQTTIGGATSLESCTISGNNGPGIKIELANASSLLGNFIGTTNTGETTLGNNGPGVQIEGSSQTQVGGVGTGESNVISGNQGPGILLKALSSNTAELNTFINNILGAKPDLSGALGNLGSNIQVDGATETSIQGNSLVGSQTGCGVLLQDTQNLIPARLKAKQSSSLVPSASVFGNDIGVLKRLGLPAAIGNALGGICVEDFFRPFIGDVTGAFGNVIGANGGPGVRLSGGRTQGFKLFGNFIGTDGKGNGGLGNLLGILVEGAQDGDIGSANAGTGNVISGNIGEALKALALPQQLPTSLRVVNNSLGLTPDGKSPLGNGKDNILLDGVLEATIQGNTIAASQSGCGVKVKDTGGVLPAFSSQVAKNAPNSNFISIAANAVGLSRLPGQPGNFGNLLGGICIEDVSNLLIGGLGSLGNVIAGNTNGPGISLFGQRTQFFKLLGNYIGTTADGRSGLGNLLGVLLVSAKNGEVGGANAGEGNVISGNTLDGVKITANDSTGNKIQGNLIGSNPAGTAPLPNGQNGVLIEDASNNTVGGNRVLGEGNVISGNGQNGVLIVDTAAAASPHSSRIKSVSNASDNKVQGNTIGGGRQDVSLPVPNGQNGLLVQGAPNTTIGYEGQLDAAFGNDIVFNANAGIRVESPNGTSAAVFVNGNSVGFGPGDSLAGNGYGIVVAHETAHVEQNRVGNNHSGGITLDNSSNSDLTDNEVRQNTGVGVTISGMASTNNSLRGNTISNNTSHGVEIVDGARLNTVGGPLSGAGNTISFNGGAGVALDATAGHCNNIDPNTIFGNGGGGIDLNLDQNTPNDPGDADEGPNRMQNYPEFASVLITQTGNLVLQFKVDSAPANSNYGVDGIYVEFFKAEASLQGETFIGSTHYTVADYSNGSPGLASFDAGGAASLGVQVGDQIVATATDADGNTSEFTSSSVGVVADQPTAEKLTGFTATAHDSNVLLNWRTGFEVDNLGFNVYREADGDRIRITPQIIAGSALSEGPGTSLLSGNDYYWADTPPPGKPVRYWLEDIDLNGKSTFNGPYSITTAPAGNAADAQKRSELISRIGLRQVLLANGLGSVPVTRAATLTASFAPSLQIQLSLASQPAVKIAVKQEGYYRVTQGELLRAGLDPKTDPRRLQLFVDGVEQPMRVTGEQDGRFDGSDSVEFYGVGLDAASTDTRVYWLVAGTSLGKRIPISQGKGDPIAAGSFPFTVERKDRTIYFSALKNGDAENFFGAVVASQPVDQSLSIEHLDQTAQAGASLEVSLQGVTKLTHSVRVQLNGADVTRLTFAGQSRGTRLVSIAQSLLREGANTVRLIAEGGPSDVSLVDAIRIRYSHSYIADRDTLALTVEPRRQVTVSGFTRKDIRLMDVTDISAPQEIAATVTEGKSGNTVTGAASGSGSRALLAFVDSQALHPWAITPNQPSSLRQPGNGADMLIVTKRDYLSTVESLRTLRQSQGLSVAVVDIEDIYDEFSFGNNSPQAVKDFAAYALTNWKKKPQYLLLAGDASYDPKNYLGVGSFDLVPTRLVDTGYMETASDDWFADFNNDGVPELAVGRLPFRNATEASTMIAKIVGYERSIPSEDVLLVADANDGFDFEDASMQLIGSLPASLKTTQINRGTDTAGAKARLLEAINRGQKIVNYVGHGSVNQWRSSLLVNEDAERMTNTDHLSVFVMMTCLNGYFDDPALDSLAESLLKAERGGAVAVWSSSGMTSPAGQARMNQELYKSLFGAEGIARLGDAIREAKAKTRDVDIRRTWVLLGDPTMSVR